MSMLLNAYPMIVNNKVNAVATHDLAVDQP
ncbi:MAG: hypothetical protein RLZZ172_226 [Bacteroidota bacterium]|jgi:hypothetical protein